MNSSVIGTNGGAVTGLCAAGELAEGIQDNNILGGNSLLEYIIFGLVAGKHAAEAVLGANVKVANLRHLSAETTKQAIERRWASQTRWRYSRPTRRRVARRSAFRTIIRRGHWD